MQNSSEIWLSVDLSSSLGTLAIHRWNKEKAEPELVREKNVGETFHHLENFLPALQALLTECGLSLKDISRLITTSGPGSFTGLRIAISSLKAIAMSFSIPIETLSASEIRALASGKENPSVVTQVAASRYSIGEFPYGEERVIERSDLEKMSDAGPFLLDEKSNPEFFTRFKNTKFPLRAGQLGAYLLKASSRKTFALLGEQIALSPNYFGNTKFD